jgi:hypothetical protein
MPRPKANFVVLDPGSGRARPGAWVTFYLANTLEKAPLYADDDLASIGNPVQANGLGQVAVRVEPGLYDVSMSWDGAQPTVVEDVLLWTPEGAVITQPGDLIVGGPTGTPTRLPMGLENEILISHQGIVEWRYLESGVGFPVGTPGSLVGYSAVGQIIAIAPGIQDQALAMQGGIPTWVSTLLPPGTTLPISQPGDLVVGAETTGAVARLGRGLTDEVLTVGETGGLVWKTEGAVSRGHGDCWLGLEASVLRLNRSQGSQLWIDGRSRTIPIPGPILAATGLTPDTTYYIYAAWVGGAMVLEASTTGYNQYYGLNAKTGDESRTLVGMARTDTGASPAWVYTELNRLVMSFFHQSTVSASAFFSAPRSWSSTTVGEIHSEIRAAFLSWAGTAVQLSVSGLVRNDLSDNITINSYIGLDFIPVGGVSIYVPAMPEGTAQFTNIAATRTATLTEGYHILTLLGQVSAGAGVWQGDPGGLSCCRTNVLLAPWA